MISPFEVLQERIKDISARRGKPFCLFIMVFCLLVGYAISSLVFLRVWPNVAMLFLFSVILGSILFFKHAWELFA